MTKVTGLRPFYMMKLYSSQTINDIKARHDFRFAKSLGQNFLTDRNIIEKIVEGSGIGPSDFVIEIGPGIGVLTKEILDIGAKVTAVEIDSRLIPILQETLSGYEKFNVINQDIMKTDLNGIAEANLGYENIRIIGNLPYYITTPIIMKILEDRVPAASVTCMMQKEVADRIKAPAGSKNAGAISLAVQYYCDVTQIAKAPKEAFMPSPKVDSAVLRFDVLEKPRVEVPDTKVLFDCIRKGFGQRRKTISNSLVGAGGTAKEDIKKILEETGIEGSRRAETLSLEEFAAISSAISEGGYNG